MRLFSLQPAESSRGRQEMIKEIQGDVSLIERQQIYQLIPSLPRIVIYLPFYTPFSDNGCTAPHHYIFSWRSTIAYVIITNGTNSNKEVTGTTTPFFHAISLIYSLSDSVALLLSFFRQNCLPIFSVSFKATKKQFFLQEKWLKFMSLPIRLYFFVLQKSNLTKHST